MNVFINEHGCLLVSAGTLEELKSLTVWVAKYKADRQALWVSVEKADVPGIFYEGLGASGEAKP
jgi:hypothetical protein